MAHRPTHPTSLRVAPDPREHMQSAVASLWREHRRWVAAILLAHKPRESELDDLLQEVAVRIVAHAHELRDPAALRSWLRSVAINVARGAGRKQRVRRESRAPLHEGVERHANDAPASEHADVLHAAMTLPEMYREPLIMRALRGLSYKQIADTLGVPVTTIETRLVRARRMLRDRLDQGTTRSSVT